MKWALDGGTVDERNPLPAEYRDFQLIELTGWTFDELDDAPAARCDWLLQLAAAKAEVLNEKAGPAGGH